MRTKWVGAAVVIAVLICGTIFAMRFRISLLSSQATTTASAPNTPVAKATPPPSQKLITPTVKEPFPFKTFFPAGPAKLTYLIPGTATTVRFEAANDGQAKNPGLLIHIGTQGVSWAPKMNGPSGYGLDGVTFSSDAKYIAFRTLQSEGALSQEATVNIIDIPKAQTFMLPPLHDPSDYKVGVDYDDIMTFYDYAWNTDDTLNVTFYYAGIATRTNLSDPPQYYRISPKELWRYDPVAKKYTFLQTLPE